MKVSSAAGFIRNITVSPNGNWIAVGLTSGVISVLDTRTGLLLGTWKGHDSDILQVQNRPAYIFRFTFTVCPFETVSSIIDTQTIHINFI